MIVRGGATLQLARLAIPGIDHIGTREIFAIFILNRIHYGNRESSSSHRTIHLDNLLITNPDNWNAIRH